MFRFSVITKHRGRTHRSHTLIPNVKGSKCQGKGMTALWRPLCARRAFFSGAAPLVGIRKVTACEVRHIAGEFHSFLGS